MDKYDLIIIGAGAAGLFAASQLDDKIKTLIIERNEIVGKKLLITGKGRCNITNNCDVKELLANTVVNGKFLTNAFYNYTAYDVIDFFNNLGLKTKVERGNRIFPVSDKAADVVHLLEKAALSSHNRKIIYNSRVKSVIKKDELFIVKTEREQIFTTSNILLTTGGKSYPGTGSTGDGYSIAKSLGHTIIPFKPALVPFETKEEWVKKLQGLSLKNVSINIFDDKKSYYSDFGEMLFTHFGVSGPIILSASAFVKSPKNKTLSIDLKPALSEEKLSERILREIAAHPKRSMAFLMKTLLPKKMIPLFIELLQLDIEKQLAQLSKKDRNKIIQLLKNFNITFTKFRSIKEAIITSGGVSTKEINPKTMESKITKGLYFAGEVIDCDALTGGFNLQIAWSSAYMASESIKNKKI